MVERHLAKVNVARSNRVTRFLKKVLVSLSSKDFLGTFLIFSVKSVRAVALSHAASRDCHLGGEATVRVKVGSLCEVYQQWK